MSSCRRPGSRTPTTAGCCSRSSPTSVTPTATCCPAWRLPATRRTPWCWTCRPGTATGRVEPAGHGRAARAAAGRPPRSHVDGSLRSRVGGAVPMTVQSAPSDDRSRDPRTVAPGPPAAGPGRRLDRPVLVERDGLASRSHSWCRPAWSAWRWPSPVAGSGWCGCRRTSRAAGAGARRRARPQPDLRRPRVRPRVHPDRRLAAPGALRDRQRRRHPQRLHRAGRGEPHAHPRLPDGLRPGACCSRSTSSPSACDAHPWSPCPCW